MAEEKKELFSCRFVLNLMVILGFMFNYMLRVNITIAIVDMIKSNSTNATDQLEETRFEWDETMKNDVLGVFFWGYILTELPGGRLAEIFGARRVFGGGMLMASLITLVTPAAAYMNYYLLLALRVALGFFLGATWPAMPPMAASWIPPMDRSKFIANMMASSLGAALTMQLCGVLIEWIGWASVFYVTGVIGVIWSIVWFLIIYDSPADHPRISREEREEIERKIAEGDGSGPNVKPSKVPWVPILTSPAVWAIIIVHACSVFCYFTIVNQLPSYMDKVLGFKIKKNGFLSSLPYFGKYLMAVLSSNLADYLRLTGKLSTTATRKIFTTFACSLPALLMILQVIWGYNPTLSVFIFTASLFCNGAVTAGYLANGLDIAPNFSGTIMGFANTLSSFGGFVSTKMVAIFTKEQNTFEQWQYVFGILVFSYAFGAIIFLAMGTGIRQKWNSVQVPEEKTQELKPLNKEKEVLA